MHPIKHELVNNEHFPWFVPLHPAAGLSALSTLERFVRLFFGPGGSIPRHIAASWNAGLLRVTASDATYGEKNMQWHGSYSMDEIPLQRNYM